jgi:hypothetical protein
VRQALLDRVTLAALERAHPFIWRVVAAARVRREQVGLAPPLEMVAQVWHHQFLERP